MAKIELPKQLKQLLEDSDLQAPIRSLADRIGEILADNKLTFFPDYTDHGIDHVNCVLKSEVELVPKDVWEGCKKDSDSRLLCDADAAVIIGATLLHDIAMHLWPEGFRELVGRDSRFKPLPWFIENHEGHLTDRPWQELWDDYVREARRFSDRDLANIIGEESARTWKFHELPEDAGQWDRNHCLIIGEFIRRHHARLAHEIAIYGFPGLPAGSGEHQFPAMGKETGHSLMRLADLIGLTARSHGMSLRVCKTYLEHHYPGTPRPMGTAALYPMALLRIADYLQIDRQRAPAVLLQLRNPQSPISVQEWQKHRAVQNISPANDPRGKMVTVSTDLSLSLYLQLHDLLNSLQGEMDHSTAVLDEAYGTRTDLGLNLLNLAIRRVHSNLQNPAFRDSLPYVPKQTGFTADPNLLTLLVEPLYGKEPGVGVRELMQNAVDAVCELEAWCAAHGKNVVELDLPEQDGDVLIEFVKQDDESWFLRVRDRGIGMTNDTIQKYFLRAGASFRRSKEWANEFLDDKGQPRVTRSGRFGIGAFAVFLLGPTFKLQTRHVSADSAMGYTIEASANSQLIEIKRVDELPIGTTIEVEMSEESVKAFELEGKKGLGYKGLKRKIDWFCWNWPKVVKRTVHGRNVEMLEQEYTCAVRGSKLPPEWSAIYPNGFDAVYWTFGDSPELSCNGLKVGNPSNFRSRFTWPEETQIQAPCVAVLDSAANLPLTTQRYELSQKTVPFVDLLGRDVLLSFIAHILVCGPMSHTEALSLCHRHPLSKSQFTNYDETQQAKEPFSAGLLRWCMTSSEMVPADPWLYTLLNVESCIVYGTLGFNEPYEIVWRSAEGVLIEQLATSGYAILPWYAFTRNYHNRSWAGRAKEVAGVSERILTTLLRKGITALGHKVGSSQVIFSVSRDIQFEPNIKGRQGKGERPKRVWEEISEPNTRSRWFEAKIGSLSRNIPLKDVFKSIETSLAVNDESLRSLNREPILYMAEIKSEQVERSPESLIAKIWNKCLGPKAIPFDPVSREAMIADGCKHPELKRHIEAWQEMKRTGSKWVTGEKQQLSFSYSDKFL